MLRDSEDVALNGQTVDHQCSALDQSFQVVYLWHNVAVGGVGILYMCGVGLSYVTRKAFKR